MGLAVHVIAKTAVTPREGSKAIYYLSSGANATLLSLLALTYPDAANDSQIRDALQCGDDVDGNTVIQAIARLRKTLREVLGWDRQAGLNPITKDTGGYRLDLGSDAVIDHNQLSLTAHLAIENLPYTPTENYASLDEIWRALNSALALIPQDDEYILPGLTRAGRYWEYQGSVLTLAKDARTARCEVALLLGRQTAVLADLEAFFVADPRDADLARMLAIAKYRFEGQEASLEILKSHEHALSERRLRPQRAIEQLRNRVLEADESLLKVALPRAIEVSSRGGPTPHIRPEGHNYARHQEDTGTLDFGVTLRPALLGKAPPEDAGDGWQASLPRDWLQFTYNPKNIRMEDEPWSIEWVRLTMATEATLHGDWWRIWRDNFSNAWEFAATYGHCLIQGVYWQTGTTTSAAGRGTFHLHRDQPSLCFGMYYPPPDNQRQGRSIAMPFRGVPLVWIGVDYVQRLDDRYYGVHLREVPVAMLEENLRKETRYLPPEVWRELVRVVDSCRHGRAT